MTICNVKRVALYVSFWLWLALQYKYKPTLLFQNFVETETERQWTLDYHLQVAKNQDFHMDANTAPCMPHE